MENVMQTTTVKVMVVLQRWVSKSVVLFTGPFYILV